MIEKISKKHIEYFRMQKDIEDFHSIAEKYGFLSPRLVGEKICQDRENLKDIDD
jgi:hypothetical protein